MTHTVEELMLKYQKAKVKLLEHKVPLDKYPDFPFNYRDLAYPTVYYISEYSDAIIKNDNEKKKEFKERLSLCAEFYDAALKSREQDAYDIDFLLSGAIAYFYLDDFGSSLVMIKEIKNLKVNVPFDMRGALTDIMIMIFFGKRILNTNIEVSNEFERYLRTGDNTILLTTAKKIYYDSLVNDNAEDAFFAESIYAISLIAQDNIASILLPYYSGIPYEMWEEYLRSSKSVKMIWPAQKLIGEKGVLRGKSAVVQLPTGVGKTKSIELIIRAMFLSNRGNTALIVVPLRALCNEITVEMRDKFSSEVKINQFSDLLEIDFVDAFLNIEEQKILICTPEKLQFIFHHKRDAMNSIDLFVFDEGHMFDDLNRGSQYELLLTDIKSDISSSQQLVIMSAVLSSSNSITQWILGDNGILAFDKNIKSTPKITGFVSCEEKIHYFSDSFRDEDFYIPNAIEKVLLKTKRKTKTPKYFPENTAADMAIYFSNQLCSNGGVAVYMSQIKSIRPLMRRVMEISQRGIDLDGIKSVSDGDEISKLMNLISDHYGNSSEYYMAAKYGFFPHYSRLPNGLKVSIEHAFRNKKIKAVVCTSTLAQGVNIPIKYLLMTSVKSSYNMMTTSSFNNLKGRTARSGVYTEGSIIIADPKIYDNKLINKGRYVWDDITNLFEGRNDKSCGSAILSIVKDFEVDYETVFSGEKICRFIINDIDDWHNALQERLLNALVRLNKNDERKTLCVKKRIESYSKIIDSIENDLCLTISDKGIDDCSEEEIINMTESLCKKTLAYHLASDQESNLLLELFASIGKHIARNMSYIKNSAKSLVSIDFAKQIIDFVNLKQINIVAYTIEHLLKLFLELYNVIYKEDSLSLEECQNWISGNSYKYISDTLSIDIMDVEKHCENLMSYQFGFLLGNIIDYIDDDSPNLNNILILQKQIKYGVKSRTSISICERVFNERIIANKITTILEDPYITEERIIPCINEMIYEISDMLEIYPTYFLDRINLLCGM